MRCWKVLLIASLAAVQGVAVSQSQTLECNYHTAGLGNKQKMIEFCTAIIKIDPNNHRALENRALLSRDTGNSKQAIDDFTTIINIRRIPHDIRVNAYVSRGQIYESLGEFEKAIADYKQSPGQSSYLIRRLEEQKRLFAERNKDNEICQVDSINKTTEAARIYKFSSARVIGSFASDVRCAIRARSECLSRGWAKIRRYQEIRSGGVRDLPQGFRDVARLLSSIREPQVDIVAEYIVSNGRINLNEFKLGEDLNRYLMLCDAADMSDEEFLRSDIVKRWYQAK